MVVSRGNHPRPCDTTPQKRRLVETKKACSAFTVNERPQIKNGQVCNLGHTRKPIKSIKLSLSLTGRRAMSRLRKSTARTKSSRKVVEEVIAILIYISGVFLLFMPLMR